MHARPSRTIRVRLLSLPLLAALASAASADERRVTAPEPQGTASASRTGHAGHVGHGRADRRASAISLSETGQGAFAAIAEVVAALTADPDTDWSVVDIDALRAHLVSMDRLVLDAEVERVALEDGYRFVVRGEGRTRRALHEMVPAHAAVLAAETAWTASAERTATGATLDVTSDDDAERERIAALGFFGLMALGNHHREHHLAIATGRAMH